MNSGLAKGSKPADLAWYITTSETPVILGDSIQLLLVESPNPNYVPISTTWNYTISAQDIYGTWVTNNPSNIVGSINAAP